MVFYQHIHFYGIILLIFVEIGGCVYREILGRWYCTYKQRKGTIYGSPQCLYPPEDHTTSSGLMSFCCLLRSSSCHMQCTSDDRLIHVQIILCPKKPASSVADDIDGKKT